MDGLRGSSLRADKAPRSPPKTWLHHAVKKVPVSFLIPIKNEAANLPRCLASILWAEEIFIVDSQSSDNSAKIAAEHNAKVVQFHFNGRWPKKKNWALENLPFKHDWVFILDADEVLRPEAADEIDQIVRAPNNPINGYWINRRFMFMGRWLKHAYYPNWNLRLLRHKLGRYEKLTDSETNSGDNEVHEHIIIQGQTARLKCEMDHYAFPNIETFVEKHNRYSNWEAHVTLERQLNQSPQLQNQNVNWRRKLKALSQRLPFRPLQRFLYVYLYQRGFLDGVEGYYFARLHAYYEFLCVAKTRELKIRSESIAHRAKSI
jgi:glycosyltransferase involved in cell wall biosynthesis